jgi:DNA-binding IclR family transcriptional regulator
MSRQEKGNGIQSLELGIDILKKIASQNKSLNITEISKLTGMSKSKLHRYLTSFCKCGLLEKHEDLRYSLGSELVLLGLKASEQLDVKELSASHLSYLKETLNETAALAIWGAQGPFFLRWEESDRVVNIGVRAGSQVSIVKSAPGRLFAAFLPEEKTAELVRAELEKYGMDAESFYEDIRRVRENGVAISQGTLIPGISAISCPVFGQNGEIVAAITVVGLSGVLDVGLDSETVKLVKEQCRLLSGSLGYKQTVGK